MTCFLFNIYGRVLAEDGSPLLFETFEEARAWADEHRPIERLLIGTDENPEEEEEDLEEEEEEAAGDEQ